MDTHILSILQKKIEDFASHDVETQRNAIKEVLQYYVLNFIYHHPEYSGWVMYGGSALRICHSLDRMSVDLDFEIDTKVTDTFLAQCKDALAGHFEAAYGIGSDELAIKVTRVRVRGLVLKFLQLGDALGISHSSKQVHVKIDLNHLNAHRLPTERIPINRYQLSFVIITYTLSTLMASKIAAILLRGKRGVGKVLYGEKGRDIYDLLWYMSGKITPNLEYLKLKGIDVSDMRALFDRLTIKMNEINIKNLRDDLYPLFEHKTFIEHWLQNWHESYLRLLDGISTVAELEEIVISQDFITRGFSFVYWYKTETERAVRFEYNIEYFWIKFRDGDLSTRINDKLVPLVIWDMKKVVQSDKLLQYATLFYEKTEAYLKKTNRVIIGESIITKKIRMTADNLNRKEQIALNKSALLSCNLEDILKQSV